MIDIMGEAVSDTAILLEPIETDIKAWFAALDAYNKVPFMEEGREQPEMPPAKVDFDK
jgi:hypothetical protein